MQRGEIMVLLYVCVCVCVFVDEPEMNYFGPATGINSLDRCNDNGGTGKGKWFCANAVKRISIWTSDG